MTLKPTLAHTDAADGARVAYWAAGHGLPLLYVGVPCCSHVQVELDVPVLMNWYYQLANHFRVVRLDLRGYGGSQRNEVPIGIDGFKLDILAVADALDLDSFILLAQGGATPAAMSLASESSRLMALVVCDGWADGPNLAAHQRVSEAQVLVETNYRMFSEVMAKVILGAPDTYASDIAALLRLAAGADTWRTFLQMMLNTDVRDCLPRIACPTLVVHSGPGPLTGHGEESLAIAGAIPGAIFRSFKSPSFPLTDTESFLQAIVEFAGMLGRGRERHDLSSLSRREREVAEYLAMGWTNRRIADVLVLAVPTVERHVHNIITKLGVQTRGEVAAVLRSSEGSHPRSFRGPHKHV